jgi:NADH-quinone oxidoreductase subunit C
MDRALQQSLESTFDGLDVSTPVEDRMVIRAKRDAVLSVLSFLKHKGYDHLQLVSCVDWMEDGKLELVYVLSAYDDDDGPEDKRRANVILKTKIPRERAKMVTAISVFASAEPYEREVHELFGVVFEGHPRLTPLFLDRDYETPPFRKDFDTRQYVEDFFGSIPPVAEKEGGA